MKYTIRLDLNPETTSPNTLQQLVELIEGVGNVEMQNGDQTNFDYFSVARWHDHDLLGLLEQNNIAPTQENVDKLKYVADPTDSMVDAGWEYFQYMIDYEIDEDDWEKEEEKGDGVFNE